MANPIPGPGTNPPPVPPVTGDSWRDFRWLNAVRQRLVATITGLTFNAANGLGGQVKTNPDGTTTVTITVSVNGMLKGQAGAIVAGVPGVDYLNKVALTGDASGTTDAAQNLLVTLAATGVIAGTYGDASHVPVLVVDAKGRVTGASTAPVAAPVGATSGRPAGATDGTLYFDTSLGASGKPIWARAAAATGWVDATGAAV